MHQFEKRYKKRKKTILLLIFILVNVLIVVSTILIRIYIYNQNFKQSTFFLFNEIYLNNFLKQPPLIIGFVTFLGFLLLERGWISSLISALKSIIGFLILGIGASILIEICKPIFAAIRVIVGTSIVPLDPYIGWTSANDFWENAFKNVLNPQSQMNNFLSLITYVFLLGFALNILLVSLKKITNVHSLMITGHVMFQQATIVSTAFYVLILRNYDLETNFALSQKVQFFIVLLAGIFMGFYWSYGSSGTIKATNQVTNNANFAVGHQEMLTIPLALKLGKLFKSKQKSTNAKKLPQWLKFFQDNIFTQIVILFFLFAILMIILLANNNYLTKVDWNGNFVSEPSLAFGKIIDQNWQFANRFKSWNIFPGAFLGINLMAGILKIVAAILIIITGVRMFISELQASFQGISQKIIPNSVIAVDIAAIYGFIPDGLTYGFLGGVFRQFLSVGLVVLLSSYFPLIFVIPIPLFITLFFNSGSLGVYAHASGGKKAAFIVPFLIGFVEILVISIGLATYKKVILEMSAPGINSFSPIQTGYLGMADFNLFFGLFLIVASQSTQIALTCYFFSVASLIIYGLIQNSGLQQNPTFFQKLLKINILTKDKNGF